MKKHSESRLKGVPTFHIHIPIKPKVIPIARFGASLESRIQGISRERKVIPITRYTTNTTTPWDKRWETNYVTMSLSWAMVQLKSVSTLFATKKPQVLQTFARQLGVTYPPSWPKLLKKMSHSNAKARLHSACYYYVVPE